MFAKCAGRLDRSLGFGISLTDHRLRALWLRDEEKNVYLGAEFFQGNFSSFQVLVRRGRGYGQHGQDFQFTRLTRELDVFHVCSLIFPISLFKGTLRLFDDRNDLRYCAPPPLSRNNESSKENADRSERVYWRYALCCTRWLLM